ncbi:MAG: hypothetical protein ABI678_06175, partial [Kofleriaceae bacterium]
MWRAAVVLLLAGGVAAAACPRGPKQLAVARGAPKVDGRLDDDVWTRACFITDLVQKSPHYGVPPT